MGWWIVVTVVTLFFLALYCYDVISLQRRLRHRPKLDLASFFAMYYRQSTIPIDVVELVRETLAEVLVIHPGWIRPTDRLDVEYRQVVDFGDSIGDIVLCSVDEAVRDRYGINIQVGDWATVQDIIMGVTEQLRTAEGSGKQVL
jgi:hypothetical protein